MAGKLAAHLVARMVDLSATYLVEMLASLTAVMLAVYSVVRMAVVLAALTEYE